MDIQKIFNVALSKLSNMVYPLISKDSGKNKIIIGFANYKNTTTF